MKFVGISILLLLVLTFSPAIISANTTSSVNTYTQGSGSVTTHIQTTVNGKTTTLDSSEPGNYQVDVEADGTTNITSEPNPSVTLPPLPTIYPFKATIHEKVVQGVHTTTFFNQFKVFLKKLFSWFK